MPITLTSVLLLTPISALPTLTSVLLTGSSSGTTVDSVVQLPDDLVAAAMRAAVKHLAATISPSDADDDLPLYMDTLSEWKDFCGAFKSRLKYILSEASRLSPSAALAVSGEMIADGVPAVQLAVQGASREVIAKAYQKLEVRHLSGAHSSHAAPCSLLPVSAPSVSAPSVSAHRLCSTA